MAISFNSMFRKTALLGVAGLALLPVAAPAQTVPPAETDLPPAAADEDVPAEDIIVTGTLLRGVAPVGSNLIGIGQERLQEAGASTSNELLATVPQVSNYFNNVPQAQLAVAVNQLQTARPNLRNLSAPNAASSATLVLVDGHRVAGIGVSQSTIDPDLIPVGAIERVEVVTDGGSATYGADAVGGVINFITRKRFDGIRADARYGFADDYYTVDSNLTVGRDWGTGSLYASYSFSKNDAIFGRDRDWISGQDYRTGTPFPKGRQCAAPNVTIGGVNYAYPSSTAGSINRCDPTDNKSFVPASERHGVVVGLYQDFSDAFSVNAKAFYSQRNTRGNDELLGNVNITSANPNLFVPAGAARPAAQSVDFSFSPLLGVDGAPSGTGAKEWGVNAEFRAELGNNFQLRTLFNYSHSDSSYFLTIANNTALAAAGSGTTAATAFNPFNLAANNPALIAAITDFSSQGQSRDDLFNTRAIIDGSLFTLPGGDVRVAAGYEYLFDRFDQRFTSGAVSGGISASPFNTYKRRVHAVFGEINVPVFGRDNAVPGIQSFVLSASGRYDHYSDFGGTFNPKFGATYRPVEWLAIRGNYGTSFNAPTPLDQLGALRSTITAFPFAPFIRPGDNIGFFGGSTVALQGSNPELLPQGADTWSVGLDIDAPFAEGLKASVNYYNVKFTDILATPTPNNGIFANFPGNITSNVNGLSADVVRAFAAQDPNGLAAVNPLIAANRLIYALVDFRVGNYGIQKVQGLDFNVNYRHSTGFGSVDGGVSGNYQLSRKTQTAPGAPVVDQLDVNLLTGQDSQPRLLVQGTLGATIGGLRALATINHNSGYGIARSLERPQDRVKAYDTVNLFFKYDIAAKSGVLQDLSFTFNVNNVFDQDPPELRSTADSGFANGFTLGRLFLFGVAKKF